MSTRARVAIVAVAALFGALVTALVLNQQTSGTPPDRATEAFPAAPETAEPRDPRLPSEPLTTFSADLEDNVTPKGSPPTRISVPAISLEMPITARGVDDAGAMALPETVDELSWYKFGSAPADPGATVIAGHVDTKAEGKGPLAALALLQRGDRLAIEVDGEFVTYQVNAVREVSKSLIDLDALFSREGTRRLHVVTCSGAYDPERGGYQANLVVVARPVD